MVQLPSELRDFLCAHGYVIVSTIDAKGNIHCSVKGVVGSERTGKVFLIDLYHSQTVKHLKKNPIVTITAVDENRHAGYSLKGRATVIGREDIGQKIATKWEKKIIQRISRRVVQSVKDKKRSIHHPEVFFPQPENLIVIEVREIVDLVLTQQK